MKILLINDIGSEKGGAEVVVSLLKKSLMNKGHEVRLLSGNEYYSVGINDYEYKTFQNKSLTRYILYMYNPFARHTLKKVLQDFRPDIVHLHNVSKASASILFLLKKYPTVFTTHDFECIDPTSFSKIKSLHKFRRNLQSYFLFEKSITYYVQKLRYIFIKRAQKNIDYFIAPSMAMFQLLKEAQIPSPILLIYNGIDDNVGKRTHIYRSKPYKVLFLGRLVPEKGLETLVKAINLVRKKISNVELHIVGNGPESVVLKQSIQDEGLSNNITFMNAVARDQVDALYEDADIVAVPSIWYEPLGLVAIEAMYHGVPVVASNVGGLKEIVDQGINGMLSEAENEVELASNIVTMLSDPCRLESMGAAARNTVNMFSADKFTDATIELYKKVSLSYEK